MSELIQSRNQTSSRKQFLATASAFVLMAYVTGSAKAEDARPAVWIELGGQMQQLQGVSSPFTAPFMTAISPIPGPYANDIFGKTQRPARLAFGFDGAATFQPEGSGWAFSVGLLYGRSSTNHHVHQQSPAPTSNGLPPVIGAGNYPFADSKSAYEESHTILDFSVGKDVGLGAFGHDATSTVGLGLRFAQFSNQLKVDAIGRPEIHIGQAGFRNAVSFYNYTLFAHAARSFHGIGPSLSWKASSALLGNNDAGELTFDWGISGAVLFGRQKATVSHVTHAYHMPITQSYAGLYDGYYYAPVPSKSDQGHRTSSRSVTIPNLGGFAGLSVKYPNVKFSLGYKAEFFFGAVDVGIDERHTKTLGFNGPFASISIGLGG